MCQQCEQIDAKIARYRRLAEGINERKMIDHVLAFIIDLDAEKLLLHPATPEPTV